MAVEPLATRLGATKGSFYWHFANRDALIVSVLEIWERRKTEEIIALIAERSRPVDQLRALLLLVTGAAGRTALEAQMVAAADHPLVAESVRRMVDRRVSFVIGLLEQCGFTAEDAAARGLLLYAAYTGHDQLTARLPEALPLAAAGGLTAYVERVLALILAGAPGAVGD